MCARKQARTFTKLHHVPREFTRRPVSNTVPLASQLQTLTGSNSRYIAAPPRPQSALQLLQRGQCARSLRIKLDHIGYVHLEVGSHSVMSPCLNCTQLACHQQRACQHDPME
jgi:hypothetical protein